MFYNRNLTSQSALSKLIAAGCLFFTIICFLTATASAQETKTVLAFGDSLFSSTGLETGDSFPAQLEDTLNAAGQPTTVIEAGYYGFTTANALEVIEGVLDDNPDIDALILMFGANDYIKGINPATTRNNMDEMLKVISGRNIPTVMAGLIPPYNGYQGISNRLNDVYTELADTHQLILDPFFLEGVAGVAELNRADGIHPNKFGNQVIAQRVAPIINDMLTKIDQFEKVQLLISSVDSSISEVAAKADEKPVVTPIAVENTGQKNILVIGDSLVAGYGLDPEFAFPHQLGLKLQQANPDIKVFNAGVSGDTSSGGMARLEWVLSSYSDLDLVIVLFGGNDALRGIHPDLTRRNMDKMVTILKRNNMPTMIAGMVAPPNLGKVYGDNFNSIFPDVATKHDVALYPFYLDGVGGVLELNQNDRIHPNEDGVKYIVERIAPQILDLVSIK